MDAVRFEDLGNNTLYNSWVVGFEESNLTKTGENMDNFLGTIQPPQCFVLSSHGPVDLKKNQFSYFMHLSYMFKISSAVLNRVHKTAFPKGMNYFQ